MNWLLDETDRTRRLIQHGAILLGINALLIAGREAGRPGRLTRALVLIGVGLLLFVVSIAVQQHFAVTVSGHEVRLVNSPLLGERVFLDGKRVGKGRLGKQSVIRLRLPTGERVVVIGDAGVSSYRGRIGIETASATLEEPALLEV